jgi:ABC-type uncharacterized transport system substrate-binding protein
VCSLLASLLRTLAGGWLNPARGCGTWATSKARRQTITLEVRWDEHHPERWPELAADLVRLHVDCLVVGTTAATWAAKHATSTIPIVMPVSGDPVGVGLVASLAQPGGRSQA